MSGSGAGEEREVATSSTMPDLEEEGETEAGASELGTKEYWDKDYEFDMEIYMLSGDMVDEWFSREVVPMVFRHLQELGVPLTAAVLDMGCGNGGAIRALFRLGWTNLTGYDFSEKAIELCNQIATDDGLPLTFKVVDLVMDEDFSSKFLVCHDKGTYDAIGLNRDISSLESRNKYLFNVWNLLEENGYFVIATCNWTVNELVEQFTDWFVLSKVIPTGEPKFTFGGVEGNKYSVAIFTKKHPA